MCGICGFFSINGFADNEQIKKMNKILTHRGPDDEGYYVDNLVALGMRRLSIIDLNTGHQPTSNEDESLFIVFNGEIYNYLKLKDILEKKGHEFKTNSDTEVIIHAYEELGHKCLDILNGMFAFCIWDTIKKELFIARDRLGIKPLYYYFDNENFLFGSEIKSILTCDEIEKKIDFDAVRHFLGYEYVPTPMTIFENIKKLPAGSYIIFDGKNLNVCSYWDLKFEAINKNKTFFENNIIRGLEESIKLRMISDVPLGAFLSGGIDSSAIVALMSKQSENPIKTFSIGFEDSSYNELKYANIISETFNTNHTEKIIYPDVVNLIERIITYFDEPFADTSAIPTFLVSELAKKDVSVVLSGDGGDELFAGYERYVASKVSNYYFMPSPIIRFFSNISPQKQKKGFLNKLQRFNEGLLLPNEARHLKWQFFMNSEQENELFTSKFKNNISVRSIFDSINNYYDKRLLLKKLDKEQYTDIKHYLPDDILIKVDRMTMANSLEARVPFLDHNLVELCSNVPTTMRLNGLHTKYILKRSLKNILPKRILNRKKEGFSIPMKNWLKKELKEYMVDTLHRSEFVKQGFFQKKSIENLINGHLREKRNNGHQIWSLICLEKWYENYMLS